jgi:putative ATP-dependent endonuclease of OLD family
MFASQIRIHNFRSYTDATVDFYPYGLLAGKNNCGKSNLVDAVRVFYEDLKYDKDRDFPKYPTEDEEVWLEIEYRPTSDELENLKKEYRQRDGTFRVRKYLQSDEKDSEGKTRSGIYAYVEGELSDTRFYGAKNVQQGKLGRIIHIPPISTLSDSTKLTGPSPLRDLLNVVLESIIDSSEAYESLRHAFQSFEGSIKQERTSEGVSLEAIEQEITAGIKDWNMEFELAIKPLDLQTMVKYLVGHSVKDLALDTSMSPESHGQGFQRHFIFTLIRLAAQFGTKSQSKKDTEFSPSLVWLLYEEPEAFLHPSHIDILDRSLRELSSGDGAQVLITTHNPQFVSRNIEDLPALVKLQKGDAVTSIGQLSESDVQSLFYRNQEEVKGWIEDGLDVTPDDLTEEMEAAKHALWLNPLRCSAFFADVVLLVEGPTERALIPRMISDGRLQGVPTGLFVVDCLGKFNIHRFMNLFSKLRISHAVLFDKDNDKHPQVESTIMNSSTEYTVGIAAFPDKLESFLGLPHPGKSHRKPQHVMFHYREGLIETQNLEALANMISGLFS